MNFLFDRETFNVSKKTLNFLIESVDLFERKQVESDFDCIFKNSTDPFAKRYCEEFCNKKCMSTILVPKFSKKTIGICKPSKNQLVALDSLKKLRLKKLVERKSLYITPLQIKVMLSYFALANNKGIINLLPKKSLAKFIGCSTKSIDNCNIILEKLNLIQYNVTNTNELIVVINNYSEQHKQNGTGYVVMSNKLLNKLFNINHTHQMRLCLKAICVFDANKFYGKKTIFTLDKIKSFLPLYKQTKSKLKTFINSIVNIFKDDFEIKSTEIGIEFNISEDINGKELRESLKIQHAITLKTKLKNIIVPDNSLNDKIANLVQLSLDYGIKPVLKVLKNINEYDFVQPTESFGRFIRYRIEKMLFLQTNFFEIN